MEYYAGGIRAEVNPKKEKSTHVSLKVQGEPDNEVIVRIKREVPLRTLMLAYCDKLGLEYYDVRFCFDGKRVKEFHTANDLGLQDHDVIDAWIDQKGGGGGSDSVPLS